MSNPIQGNERFTKVSNTVVSTVAVEDALNNANVLVERVATGFVPLTKSSGGFLNVFAKEDQVLALPEGAIVTRVLTYFNDDLKFGADAMLTTYIRDGKENPDFDDTNIPANSRQLDVEENVSTMTQNIVRFSPYLEQPAQSGFGTIMISLVNPATRVRIGTYITNRDAYDTNPDPATKADYDDAIFEYGIELSAAIANGDLMDTAGTLQLKIHYITPEI